MRKVEVSSYQLDWPSLFEEEAEKLREVLKDELIEIHHIGSTAVPDLEAKPIIDMMPVVKQIDRIDAYNEMMQELGYEPRGENGLPGRRYFQKGGHLRTHHVHIYEVGDPQIERHLAFRDYLRSHPEEREKYGELKSKLANQFTYDIEGYINGKDQFVREIERKAIEWARKPENPGF